MRTRERETRQTEKCLIMITNAIFFLFSFFLKSIQLNVFFMLLCDNVTDVEKSFVSGEISFAFFLFHTRIEIVSSTSIIIIIIILYLYISIIYSIWSTIAFTATILIVWLCWLHFLFDDHVFLCNNFAITGRFTICYYLRSSCFILWWNSFIHWTYDKVLVSIRSKWLFLFLFLSLSPLPLVIYHFAGLALAANALNLNLMSQSPN